MDIPEDEDEYCVVKAIIHQLEATLIDHSQGIGPSNPHSSF
jgi:hypothetical protein